MCLRVCTRVQHYRYREVQTPRQRAVVDACAGMNGMGERDAEWFVAAKGQKQAPPQAKPLFGKDCRMLEIARILVTGSPLQQLAWLTLCALIVYTLQRIMGTGRGKSRNPPVETGWVPWLGVGVAFGKNPVCVCVCLCVCVCARACANVGVMCHKPLVTIGQGIYSRLHSKTRKHFHGTISSLCTSCIASQSTWPRLFTFLLLHKFSRSAMLISLF